MNALIYAGLFLLIVGCIAAGGLAIVWAMHPPNALDDELSRVDIDTDRAELEEINRPALG